MVSVVVLFGTDLWHSFKRGRNSFFSNHDLAMREPRIDAQNEFVSSVLFYVSTVTNQNLKFIYILRRRKSYHSEKVACLLLVITGINT